MTEADVTGAVTEVRAGHRFDEAALARYLGGGIPGVEAGLQVRQFEGGQSNPTFLLETDAGAWVLRKKPSGELVRSAHLVEREWQVLRALAGSGVPVPDVPIVCTDASVIGTPFFVMSYARGRIEKDPSLPGSAPDERRRIYLRAIEMLARLHDVDYAARGLEGFGKPADYIARQIARWSKQYEDSHLTQLPALEWLSRHLAANVPPPSRATLVHGDYRLDNVVLAPRGARLIAVLDWELSTLGEPLADLAHFLLPHFLPRGDHAHSGLVGHDLAALGIPSADELVAHYAAARQLAGPTEMRFYLAFAMFRFAAILVGVGRRAHDGNASSAHAANVGALALLFAERGQQLAEGR